MIKTHSSTEQSIGRWVVLIATLLLTSTLQAAQVGVDWQWANPKPQGNPFNTVTYNNTLGIFAAGDSGKIVNSTDGGVTWTTQASGTSQKLNSLLNNNSFILYAVGENGTILTRSDVNPWGPQNSGTTAGLNGIARDSANLFVAVGDNGTILSNDLDTTPGWTIQAVPAGSGNLMSIAWSPTLGLFAAVSDNGKILASVDGINWTFEFFTPPVNGFTAPSGFRAVTWDSTNSQFVAVGVSGIVELSTDGTNWTQQTAPTTITLTGVAQQGATLVAVGKFGGIETSTNGGTSWTEQLSGPDLMGVTSDGSQFIAVGRGGRIIGSSNGVTWSQQQPTTSVSNSRISDVVWNGTQFLAIGLISDGSGNQATLSSADGISWSANSAGVDGAPTGAVIWDGSQFVGLDTSFAYISNDGTTWAVNTVAPGINLKGIVWDGTQFITVGLNGVVFTSLDAVNWTARTSGITNVLYAVSGNGSVTVTVGGNGALLSSSDGAVNWSAPSVPSLGTTSLFEVIWNGTQFITVGDGGTILTSSDGTSWTSQTSGTTDRLRGVSWDGAQFIAVSGLGSIITSPNGVTWTSQTSGTTNVLTAVAGTDTRLVAVGWDGTILTSAGTAPPPASVSPSSSGGCTLNPRAGFDPTLLLWLLIGAGVLLRRKPVKS